MAPRPAPLADESTVRMTPGPQRAVVESEAPTTRFASARNVVRSAVSSATNAVTQRQPAQPAQPAPPAGEREIESWLGDLRGSAQTAAPQQHSPSSERTEAIYPAGGQPDSEATTAIPVQRARPTPAPEGDDDATRAIPVSKAANETNDSKAATNRINARGENQPEQTGRPQRSGDSVSAQDLLRREGRL